MRYSTCKGMVIIGESKVGLFFVFLEYLELWSCKKKVLNATSHPFEHSVRWKFVSKLWMFLTLLWRRDRNVCIIESLIGEPYCSSWWKDGWLIDGIAEPCRSNNVNG
jgi:hypothetical protein